MSNRYVSGEYPEQNCPRCQDLEDRIEELEQMYLELKRLRKGEAMSNLALQRKYEELEAMVRRADTLINSRWRRIEELEAENDILRDHIRQVEQEDAKRIEELERKYEALVDGLSSEIETWDVTRPHEWSLAERIRALLEENDDA